MIQDQKPTVESKKGRRGAPAIHRCRCAFPYPVGRSGFARLLRISFPPTAPKNGVLAIRTFPKSRQRLSPASSALEANPHWHLLKNPEGRRLALIINEFGDIGIDAEILNACGDLTCGADSVVNSQRLRVLYRRQQFLPAIERILTDPLPDQIIMQPQPCFAERLP